MDKKTALPVSFLVPVFLMILAGFPLALSAYPVLIVPTPAAKLVALCVFPILFSVIYVGIAAVLSMPFHRAIVRGKFPRQVTHFVYGPRRLYGLCWGAVFYFTPVYYAFMSIPFLKNVLLRGFGYRGDSDVNLAPDAWIRDLPLLNLRKGAYVANKATVGTNICLADGNVLVDSVSLGESTLVGHLTMLAPGCSIGDRSEIGVGCAIGIRVIIGNASRVAPSTTVNHGAQIGSNVEIGTMSYIGLKSKIADGIKIPSGANIPEGAEIRTQEDVAHYVSSETRVVSETQTNVEEIYRSRLTRVTSSGPAAVALRNTK